jgi:hypothetical protein
VREQGACEIDVVDLGRGRALGVAGPLVAEALRVGDDVGAVEMGGGERSLGLELVGCLAFAVEGED